METDVVVIGAGQAGLSAAWALARRPRGGPTGDVDRPGSELDVVVLDANSAPGGAWQHRWPSLRMATVHGIFALPGMRFRTPRPDQPAREAVPAYFARYEAELARELGLRVHRPVRVAAVHDEPDGRLRVDSDAGTWRTRALVNATGTWTRPFWPAYPGREVFAGEQLHAVDYRGPRGFTGRHVLVVGGGTTATGLLAELSAHTRTSWVTRREPVLHDGGFTAEHGREVIARVAERVRQGRPAESVSASTGLFWTPALREAEARGALRRRPMFDRLTRHAVVWDDPPPGLAEGRLEVDVVLWCTGWRAALEHLSPLGLREPGGGIRMAGTEVVADPRVHLVGYGPSASTVGANRAGRAAAAAIRRTLTRRTIPAGRSERAG